MRTKLAVILIALLIPLQAGASLHFGAAATDRVDISANASINNLGAFTVIEWFKLGTLTPPFTQQFLYGRQASGAGRKFIAQNASGSAELNAAVERITTNSNYVTSSGPLAANVWTFIAFSYNVNGSAGNVGNLYSGTLTSPVKEVTYGTNTDGSGGLFGDDSSTSLKIANANSNARSPNANIAYFGYWNRKLTLGEIKDQQYHPHVTQGNVVHMWLGFSGTGTQPDWSGYKNNGTPSGTPPTIAANVPLGAPFAAMGGGDGDSLAFNEPSFMERMIALRDGFINKAVAFIRRII